MDADQASDVEVLQTVSKGQGLLRWTTHVVEAHNIADVVALVEPTSCIGD